MLADPADGQKVGWIMDSERMGSPGGRLCESSTWPAQCVLFAERTAQVTDRQSTCAHVGNPLGCEVCFWNAQGDVMAARVVGIRQEGESLPDGAVQEGRGTKYASSCHDVMGKVQGARAASCRAGAAQFKIKMENKSKPRFRVNRIPR